MLVLNPSRLTRFIRCEYEGYVYAVLRVFPRARYESIAADRGKAFHALLACALDIYATSGEVFAFEGKDGDDEALAIFEDLYEKEGLSFDDDYARGIVDAVRFQIPRLNLPQWEILRIGDEHAIELDLRAPSAVEGVELQAIVDVVFRHRKTKKIWLPDWKSSALALDTRKLLPYLPRPDYQLALQRRILAHHGVDVDSSALVHMRSMAPQDPPLTAKTKQVSRSVNDLACDWATYEDALERYGEDPQDKKYDKVREALSFCVFSRWRHDVSTPTERAHADALIDLACAKLRAFADGEELPFRALQSARVPRSRMCDGCDYDAWCRAGLRHELGYDRSLLAVDYKAAEDSPIAGPVALAPPFNPDAAFVEYARECGRTIAPHEEMLP